MTGSLALHYTDPAGSIAYEVSGESGSWVVFCHALATSRKIWRAQAESLSSTHRVLVYDLPGHGDSDPRNDGDYRFESLSDALVRLMNYLRIQTATLVGVSVGGEVAQAAAAHYPELFEKLILLSTACYSSPERRAVWDQRLAQTLTVGMAGIAGDTATRWFSPMFAHRFPSVVSECRGWISATSLEAYAGLVRVIQDLDMRAQNRAIQCRTAIIYGDLDHNTGEKAARMIAETIARCEVFGIQNAGHFPNLESPREVRSLIVEF